MIDLDEEIGSLQGSVHRGDKDNIDVPAAREVLFGKGSFGALLPAFLTEATVDVSLVEMYLGEWLFTVQKIFVVMCISVEL